MTFKLFRRTFTTLTRLKITAVDFSVRTGVPKVYLLGPPSIDRTLVCTALSLRLGLTHITCQSLMEMQNTAKQLSASDWTSMVKRRIKLPDCIRNGWLLEGFPRTRNEAFLLRKMGIFPSHIVLIEPCDLLNMSIVGMSDEMQDYLGNKSLILDFHQKSYLKTFCIDSDVDSSIKKVVDFVRSKMHPPMPYLPRVLLMGPYGSGRRTVAKRLSEKYNLVEVNYQEELRKAAMKDSAMKQKICDVLKKSSPIPDDLLVDIASQRLLQKDCVESGWVMYNFPDTVMQAELLVKALEGFQVNRAMFLDASLPTCVKRVEPRRLDPITGKHYHLKINPCSQMDIMERLIQLPQDSLDSVKAEYSLYLENVEQLKMFFSQNLSDDISVEVNADESEEGIFESVQGAILQSSKMKLLL